MPLYYGIILPKELFWATFAEAYIKKKNKERTFDNPISELLYLLDEEFGDEENEPDDEAMDNMDKNALEILDKDEWNFQEELFQEIYFLKLPKNYRFLGYKIDTEEDTFYILDNIEFDDTYKADKLLKEKGFQDFRPKLCYYNTTLYGGEKLKTVEGLEEKNKI